MLALVCVVLGACPRTPVDGEPKELRIGKQRGFVTQQHSGQGQGAVPGDLALAGPALEVVVRASAQSKDRGALVSLKQTDGKHDWDSLQLLLALDGVRHEPRWSRTRFVRAGKRPAIELEGTVESERTQLTIRRLIRIADVGTAVRISTHVAVVRGSAPRELQVIERVAFGGGSPRAPLHGDIRPNTTVETEWVARVNEAHAVLVASLAGNVIATGKNVDHAHSDYIRYVEVAMPTTADGPSRHDAEAVLVVSKSGLGQAVRALGWVRGKPFTEAVVMLSAQPPETSVEVVEGTNGRFVVSAIPDEQRRAIVPLPDAVLGTSLAVGAISRASDASEKVPLEGPPYAPVELTIVESSVLLVKVRHAVTGEALPARVRLLPLRGTRPVKLGPDSTAAGALDTVIVSGGQKELRVPPGFYRVIVTHGPEWTVTSQQVDLGVGKRVELTATLERAIDPGPWVACEFHVHQSPSPDSQVTLEDRVASLVAEGIAFAIPTDHDHVTDFGAAIAAQPLHGLFSVPGVEVTTAEPIFGHFNAFPFPLDPTLPSQGAPDPHGWTPAALFASLHGIDPELMVQVNHPRFEGGIGYFDVAGYDAQHDHGGETWSADFDALEIWNGFELARAENMERLLFEWLAMLEHGHRIVATGSSDSHTIRSEGAGYPRTYVRAPLAGVAQGKALVRSLREGRAFVTSGPFLTVRIGERGIGDAVELRDAPLALEVFVQVPAWMQETKLRVYLGSTLIHASPLGNAIATTDAGRRYRRSVPLKVDQAGPLVVIVEGDQTLDPVIARGGVRPYAFTNPIWLVRPGPE